MFEHRVDMESEREKRKIAVLGETEDGDEISQVALTISSKR